MERKSTIRQDMRRVALVGGAVSGRLYDALSEDFDLHMAVTVDAAALLDIDVLVTASSSDSEIRTLLLGDRGWLRTARPGLLLVDTSYISEPLSREIDAAARHSNVDYLRAPLTLGPGHGDECIQTAMVSGPRLAQERAQALLEAIAGNIVRLGDGEEARAMTRVLDVMTGVSMAMWAEALVFGEAVGLNRSKMLEVIETSAVGSPHIQSHTARVAARDFGSTQDCEHLAERLGAALVHGKATGVVLNLTGQAHQMYLGALRYGLGRQDVTAIIPWLEQAAGKIADA